VPTRRTPPPTPPDLSPEKAYAALSKQLESLQALKSLGYQEGETKEKEWAQFTGNIIARAFASDSPNRSHFADARSTGDYFMTTDFGYPREDHALNHRNYAARIQAYEDVLNSCLAELKLDLPEPEIQSVFEPGQEYELYRAVKTILGFATKEIFIIDPYINAEMFEVYADSIPRTVSFRLLTNNANIPSAVLSLAQKYAAGGNLKVRSSTAIHDRVLFADNRVWVCGQSLKDAAKKKPTYIVEHDGPLMRRIYEDVWANATSLI
jgi:hypothetical protein